MRSASSKYGPLDFCSTGQTGLPVAPVDLKVILKLSTPVNGIQAGTLIVDAGPKRVADRPVEVFQIAI